eukprot:641239-Alexandrium_andersonii.AAC.1
MSGNANSQSGDWQAMAIQYRTPARHDNIVEVNTNDVRAQPRTVFRTISQFVEIVVGVRVNDAR